MAFLLADLGPDRAQAVKAIRDVFGLGVGEITAAAGRGRPLAVRTLFDRAAPAFPDALLALLRQLDDLAASVTVYELADAREYDPSRTYYQITADRLHEMICRCKDALAAQRFLGSLESMD